MLRYIIRDGQKVLQQYVVTRKFTDMYGEVQRVSEWQDIPTLNPSENAEVHHEERGEGVADF